MSEENNIYESNNEEMQYTPAPEVPPAGNNTYYGEPVNYSSDKGTGTGLGIASMILGIVSLIGCCGFWYISIPCAIVAIILGIVQCVKNESKGMAIAGIICGAIGIVLSILIIIFTVILLSSGVYYDILNQYGYY